MFAIIIIPITSKIIKKLFSRVGQWTYTQLSNKNSIKINYKYTQYNYINYIDNNKYTNNNNRHHSNKNVFRETTNTILKMAANNMNITQNATNNINSNNSAFTQTREKPSDVPTYQLANPQEDHHQILTLANTDPSDHQLPQQLPQFSHDRPLPIPAQWPMLMLNIAVPGVTQLPRNLKRPTTSADPTPKLTTPIVDQEWLHLLFKHPHDQDYNQWRQHAQYMEAPTILESNIHIALRKLQLGYLRLATMQRRSRDPVVNQIKDIRNEFAKLDLYTQNWVLQILAKHQQAPKHSKINCNAYIPGKDHVVPKTWKRSTVDIENYVNRVTRFWDTKTNDDHYKSITIYPHQKYNLHPMFVN